MRIVEFRVVKVSPGSNTLVTADWEIHCEGEALGRKDDNASNTTGNDNTGECNT